jgi:hypothetical protein
VAARIFVSLGKSDDPLDKELRNLVLSALGVPVVGKTAGRLLKEFRLLGDLSNQEASGVGRGCARP